MRSTLEQFLQRARALDSIRFEEVMAVIAENYTYTPTAFTNGLGDDRVVNQIGNNEGSCKLLAFAQLQQLGPEQTLNLFGDYYHLEVLGDPQGAAHANIRAFMRSGWDGVCFDAAPLSDRVERR